MHIPCLITISITKGFKTVGHNRFQAKSLKTDELKMFQAFFIDQSGE
jgi:hypothetical protein